MIVTYEWGFVAVACSRLIDAIYGPGQRSQSDRMAASFNALTNILNGTV